MACVGGVYSVGPFRRTVEEVLDEILRKEKQAARPRPQNKRLRAVLTQEVEGVEVNAELPFRPSPAFVLRFVPAVQQSVLCHPVLAFQQHEDALVVRCCGWIGELRQPLHRLFHHGPVCSLHHAQQALFGEDPVVAVIGIQFI
jgi:hypothetical protein